MESGVVLWPGPMISIDIGFNSIQVIFKVRELDHPDDPPLLSVALALTLKVPAVLHL